MTHEPIPPDRALAELREGNRRHREGRPTLRPATTRLAELAQAQHPFCAVLGCADSRVPPELVFDCGLGELFVVRNAGNLADQAALGSLEYAVGVLGVPLLLVLGHQRCGAVAAAVAVAQEDKALPGAIGPMIGPILPAVLHAARQGGGNGDLAERAARESIRRTVRALPKSSAILAEAQRSGGLQVVGGIYDLEHGSVTFFESEDA